MADKIISDSGFKLQSPATATTTTAGVVKQCAKIADSTATDVATLKLSFNTLLTALKTAGIMSST